jgi:hypothetical protein
MPEVAKGGAEEGGRGGGRKLPIRPLERLKMMVEIRYST